MRVTLRQLQLFRTVAETLSYTEAARVSHLTQPAVFAQIRQLEAQLGQPLIERVGRRLHLTEAGVAVQRSAAAVLAELGRLESELGALRGLGAGRLDLAVVSTAKYTLPRLIGGFVRDHPGIDIRLTVVNRSELIERYRAQRDDLFVMGAVPPDLGADHCVLAANPIEVVAAPDHPLAGVRGIALAELLAHPLIMREEGSGTRRAAEAAFEAAGLIPRVRLVLGANEAVKQAVMAGLGVAILSRGVVQLELDHGYLVALDAEGFPLARDWSLAWNPDRTLSRAAQALRDRLRAEAGARRPAA